MFLYILTYHLPVTSLSLPLLRKFAISCGILPTKGTGNKPIKRCPRNSLSNELRSKAAKEGKNINETLSPPICFIGHSEVSPGFPLKACGNDGVWRSGPREIICVLLRQPGLLIFLQLVYKTRLLDLVEQAQIPEVFVGDSLRLE